jgi:hypothetical protein
MSPPQPDVPRANAANDAIASHRESEFNLTNQV